MERCVLKLQTFKTAPYGLWESKELLHHTSSCNDGCNDAEMFVLGLDLEEWLDETPNAPIIVSTKGINVSRKSSAS